MLLDTTSRYSRSPNLFNGNPMHPGFRFTSSGLQALWRIFFDLVVPAWIAGTQTNMDVSGGIPADLDAGSHAGTTDATE